MSDLPDSVLEVMADAMLDPKLRTEPFNKTTLPSGNAVRKDVLRRALAAAEALGWVMQIRRS
jgi:hypothetical protein